MDKKREINSDLNNDMKSTIDNITMKVYGTANTTKTELEDANRSFLDTIASVLSSSNDLMPSDDIITSLRNYYNEKGMLEDSKNLDEISNIIQQDGMSSQLLSFAFLSYNNIVQAYKDMDLIVRMVPQLGECVNIMTDSILSADDVGSLLSLNVDSEERKNLELLDEKYDLFNFYHRCIRERLIYGTHRCSIIPYKKAFADVKNDYLKKHNVSKEVLDKILSDSNTKETKKEKNNKNDDNTMLKESLESMVFCDGIENILDISTDVNDIETLTETSEYFNSVTNILNESRTKLHNNTGFITSNKKSKSSNDTQFKNMGVDEINGCYIKHLDITKTIPIEVDGVPICYFYIEDDGLLKSINDAGTDPMSLMNASSNYAATQATDPIRNNNDIFIKKLSDTIMNTICNDKKFIKANDTIKEDIYSIIKYGNMVDKKLRITYIPANQVMKFGNGESMIKPVLFYGRIYLSMLTANLAIRITRGPDKRIFSIKNSTNKNTSNSLARAVRELKKDSRSILSASSINNMLNVASSMSDLFVRTDESGQKPYDVDVISGQDVPLKDDIMEFIESRMVEGTGVPANLLQSSAETDFASTGSMLNSKYLRRVLTNQRIDKKSLSQSYNQVRYYELYSTSPKDEYQPVEITFQIPSSLGVKCINEQLGNSKDMVDTLVRTYVGDSGGDEVYADLTKRFMKHFCPYIPWATLDKIFEECKESVKINSDKSDEEE